MIEKLLNNQLAIKHGVTLLNQFIDVALIGAGTNPAARKSIVLGSVLAGIGAIGIVLGGGVVALEIGAAASVVTGVAAITKGLFQGFETGNQLAKTREESVNQLADVLIKSNSDLNKNTMIDLLKSIFIIPNSKNAI